MTDVIPEDLNEGILPEAGNFLSLQDESISVQSQLHDLNMQVTTNFQPMMDSLTTKFNKLTFEQLNYSFDLNIQDEDLTPEHVPQAIEDINTKLEEKKDSLRQSQLDQTKEVSDSLTDLTTKALDKGIIDENDLNQNGHLDAGNMTFDGEQPTAGEKSANEAATNNAEELKKDPNFLKKALKKIKEKWGKISGTTKKFTVGILVFILTDILSAYGSGRSIWHKDKTIKTDTVKYSGCYVINNESGELSFIPGCKFLETNMFGADCNRCCNNPKPPDKLCPNTCEDGLAGMCPTKDKSCPCKDSICQYPAGLDNMSELIKNNATNYCTFSGDPFNLSYKVCGSAVLSCNSTRVSGGICTDDMLRNAIGGALSIDNLENYTFQAYCINPNDVFLINNLIAETIGQTGMTKGAILFRNIMLGISGLMFIVVIIWYISIFFKKKISLNKK
jgi:hypothetical protein